MATITARRLPLCCSSFYQWWDETVERWPRAQFKTTMDRGEARQDNEVVAWFLRDLHSFHGYVTRSWND